VSGYRYVRTMTSVGGNIVDEQARFTSLWIAESKTTSKVLSRIPEDSTYKPDPKSRTAQEIAWQIVCEEKMLIDAMATGNVAWAPPEMPGSMKDVAAAYDQQASHMAERWKALPPERWAGKLDFFGTARDASGMAWSFLLDIVHHRGQISTYLRPMGSTVPQIYGPSADEP
jgi:uncharacterized damage-inducible protein DinB